MFSCTGYVLKCTDYEDMLICGVKTDYLSQLNIADVGIGTELGSRESNGYFKSLIV